MAKRLLRVRVVLQGTKPMLQDELLERDVLLWVPIWMRQPELSVQEEAEQRLYRGPSGELGVPAWMLMQSIVGAARFCLEIRRFLRQL